MGFGLFSRSIHLISGDARMSGDLCVPDRPIGLMVLVSGQSGDSTTIREAAGYFERRGFATLVLEHNDCRMIVSDIDWAAIHPALERVPVSCWAASSLAGEDLVNGADSFTDAGIIPGLSRAVD